MLMQKKQFERSRNLRAIKDFVNKIELNWIVVCVLHLIFRSHQMSETWATSLFKAFPAAHVFCFTFVLRFHLTWWIHQCNNRRNNQSKQWSMFVVNVITRMRSKPRIPFDVESVDTESCTRRGPRDVSTFFWDHRCSLFSICFLTEILLFLCSYCFWCSIRNGRNTTNSKSLEKNAGILQSAHLCSKDNIS